jgi:hypothetical protein
VEGAAIEGVLPVEHDPALNPFPPGYAEDLLEELPDEDD